MYAASARLGLTFFSDASGVAATGASSSLFLRFFSFLALAGAGVLTAAAVCETWGVLCDADLGPAFLPVAGRGVESESDDSLSESEVSDDCSSPAAACTGGQT